MDAFHSRRLKKVIYLSYNLSLLATYTPCSKWNFETSLLTELYFPRSNDRGELIAYVVHTGIANTAACDNPISK